MANEGTIPEVIKLGGVEYKVSEVKELQELLAAVRKQEKDKLYSDIKEKEAEVKDLANKLKAAEDKSTTSATELKKIQDELAVAKKSLDDSMKELETLKKEPPKPPKKEDEERFDLKKVQELIDERLNGLITKLTETLTKQIEGLKGNLDNKTVSDYKKEVLDKFKGVIIPELVSGNTTEEIDASVRKAIETSKPYITVEYEGKKMTLAEKEKLVAEKEKTPATPPPAPPAPPGKTNADLSGKELLENVKTMSEEEYKKNREAVLKEAKQLKYTTTEEK